MEAAKLGPDPTLLTKVMGIPVGLKVHLQDKITRVGCLPVLRRTLAQLATPTLSFRSAFGPRCSRRVSMHAHLSCRFGFKTYPFAQACIGVVLEMTRI